MIEFVMESNGNRPNSMLATQRYSYPIMGQAFLDVAKWTGPCGAGQDLATSERLPLLFLDVQEESMSGVAFVPTLQAVRNHIFQT